MAKPKPGGRRPRKRERKNVTYGVAHIKSSFNNTIISISDQDGNVLAWASAGNIGFKGSKKSTPYAAQMAAEQCDRRAMEHGVRKVGAGKERDRVARRRRSIRTPHRSEGSRKHADAAQRSRTTSAEGLRRLKNGCRPDGGGGLRAGA